MIEFYNHQKKALDLAKNFDRIAFWHDMGLGKTFTGAEQSIIFNNDITLVVCQKSKINDWIEHYKTYYDVNVYDLTKNIVRVDNGKKHILIINYDLVWRREWIKNLKNFTLVLDESSLICNSTSKRSKFILKLKPDNVILLSGSPTAGKYEKLWSQCKLLGWKITKKEYYEKYIIEKDLEIKKTKYPIKLVIGYKNIDDLKENLKNNGAQFLKTDEVLDLPEQIFNIVNSDITKEYKEFRKDKIIEIDGNMLVGDNTLTKMLYERQLCGMYNKNKINNFIDLIESSDDRFIVFYNFKEELNILKSVINKPYSEVNGSVKDLTNYENKSNSVTFIQYQSGSMGLNLQKANKIIYFTLPLSCDNYMQSLKRIHRIGQKGTCFYYLMICKNSIEDKIYKALKRGEDYTNKLFEKD